MKKIICSILMLCLMGNMVYADVAMPPYSNQSEEKDMIIPIIVGVIIVAIVVSVIVFFVNQKKNK